MIMGENVDTVSHFDTIIITVKMTVKKLYWHCSNQVEFTT